MTEGDPVRQGLVRKQLVAAVLLLLVAVVVLHPMRWQAGVVSGTLYQMSALHGLLAYQSIQQRLVPVQST